MKFLLCPDSFKGTLSSREVADAMERGVLTVFPDAEVLKVEIGDGGEGTIAALVSLLSEKGLKVKKIECRVCDPLDREIIADYYIDGAKAYIEVASASGLTLVAPGERDVMRATTRGTGQLIADAYRRNCRDFVIALGGSATCDGGKGIYDELRELHNLVWQGQPGPLMPDCRFRLLCDVRNPMCGPEGAAFVFAPQKGASPRQVELLEKRLQGLASEYRRHRNVDVRDIRYAGAAGGIAGMFLACCEARAIDGIDYMLTAIEFDRLLNGCDMVITGEGCVDATTLHGKVISGIVKACGVRGIPVGIIAGCVNLPGWRDPSLGFNSENHPIPLQIVQSTPSGLSLADSHPWDGFVTSATRLLLSRKATRSFFS